ncbi:uncharacterized protein LOC106181556 [Lingula anatina]|uniref:Uncharacterized protein LOC106181556 n=1 Tax=Lingula anatina TaxID=7574 RepID=A0A1S3KG39_LINAN|nr:uncharacterized protein LOC106181556 [Lingula anatina]|eukprot:XP_013421429.1 uncharacterized protein LOC106181556 [Lingula anatina]
MFVFTCVFMAVFVGVYMDVHQQEAFNGVCGQTLTDVCMRLMSHADTLGLANYASKNWCKVVLDAGEGFRYKIIFEKFSLQFPVGRNCTDYLDIYDAADANNRLALLGRFCGTSFPNVRDRSTQRYTTLVFSTDNKAEAKGFVFLAVKTGPPPCLDQEFDCKAENRCIDARLRCDGIHQCNAGEDEEMCTNWEIIIGSLFQLGIGGFIGIVCAVMVFIVILYKIIFEKFSLQFPVGRNCTDYLDIYDAADANNRLALLGRFCGTSFPNVRDRSTQRYTTLVFSTDNKAEAKGFVFLAVKTGPPPCLDQEFDCKAENRCIDARLRCDGIHQCNAGEDEEMCTNWEIIIGSLFQLGIGGFIGIVCAVMVFIVILSVTVCCLCCKRGKR